MENNTKTAIEVATRQAFTVIVEETLEHGLTVVYEEQREDSGYQSETWWKEL